MAITNHFNKTAIRIRKSVASTNDYGEPTFNEDTSISFSCTLQPDDGEFEVTIQGKLARGTHRLYCLTTVDLTPGDQVEVDSLRYRVLAVLDDGGRGHHLKVMLEKVS